MAEEEEFSFMEEKIMESKKPKRQLVGNIRRSICRGVVFGIVAGTSFAIANAGISRFVATDTKEKISLKTSGATVDATEEPEEIDSSKEEEIISLDFEGMQQFYDQVAKLSKQCKRSLVGIHSYSEDENTGYIYTKEAVAGTIVANTNEYLMILTSLDSLSGKGIRVEFYDGTVAKGRLYGRDAASNLAIVRVAKDKISDATCKKLKVLTLDESRVLSVGELVFALGSPTGKINSVEYGYITGEGTQKSIEDYALDVYTTSMGYHNDGYGIICNQEGKLLGVISRGGDSTENCTFYGIGKLSVLLEKLLNKTEQSYAGITALDIPADVISSHNFRSGIYVAAVEQDSPAYEAGILVGDVISAVDGEQVSSIANYYQSLQEHEVGERVTFTVVKDPYGGAKETKVKVKLSDRK